MALLKEVLNDPIQMISRLDILTDQEREKILHHYSHTKVPYPHDKTIVELFQERVDVSPESIAVISGTGERMYHEINLMVNRIAGFLIQQYNMEPGHCVGIMLKRSELIIAGIFEILKSGVTYIPIGPDHPVSRNSYIISHS